MEKTNIKKATRNVEEIMKELEEAKFGLRQEVEKPKEEVKEVVEEPVEEEPVEEEPVEESDEDKEEPSVEEKILSLEEELNTIKFFTDQTRFNATMYQGMQLILQKLTGIEENLSGSKK